MGNPKTRSNGLPIIDLSIGPTGLSTRMADNVPTREWEAAKC
jgi:hypothetical protein